MGIYRVIGRLVRMVLGISFYALALWGYSICPFAHRQQNGSHKNFGVLFPFDMSTVGTIMMKNKEQERAAAAGQSIEKACPLRLMLTDVLAKNFMLQDWIATQHVLSDPIGASAAARNGSIGNFLPPNIHCMQVPSSFDHRRLVDATTSSSVLNKASTVTSSKATFDTQTAMLNLNNQESLQRSIERDSKNMLIRFNDPIVDYARPPAWISMEREKPRHGWEGNFCFVDHEALNYGARPYYGSTFGCSVESSRLVPYYNYAQSLRTPHGASGYQSFAAMMPSKPNPCTERKSIERQLRLNIALLKYEQHKERPAKSKFFGIDGSTHGSVNASNHNSIFVSFG